METDVRNKIEIKLKNDDFPKKQENPMTSSTVSSLASPVDSGVQLLDSESEITSLMSGSAIGCDIPLDTDPNGIKSSDSNDKISIGYDNIDKDDKEKGCSPSEESGKEKNEDLTRSDIANENNEISKLSKSVPNYFDKFDVASKLSDSLLSRQHMLNSSSKSLSDEVFEMEHPIKHNAEADLMNISLNSYELLDYTLQNKDLKVVPSDNVDMHVSLSEEVNENLRVVLNAEATPVAAENIPIVENKDVKPVEEQIVFRRQRKKKSKSDTPKKRVSFHEDILNSTKIDDIHINHGFITIEPDVSLNFFQRGFIRKPDVVKGRYSWAAEGDAPYYEKNTSDREIKSDIYINNRYSSTSSSSTGSISSSIDEEDTSDDNIVKKEPTQKLPKSSCLKKTKHKKIINTNIVHEEIKDKRRPDSNILDANIFGSLKNILSFSTSVPLAERGVPEGQEDVTVYASSVDVSDKRKSSGNLLLKPFEAIEIKPPSPSKSSVAKSNLKLTQSEGFYPNYPQQQNLPTNIILCDSDVYEHKGISYSYEFDKFQKSFEQQTKPKSSTVLQSLFKEFSFFRKKAKEVEAEEEFEIIPTHSTPSKNDDKTDDVEEVEVKVTQVPQKIGLNKYASSSKLDWDDDSISECSKSSNSRHLHSPKRKFSNTNHYSLSPFKIPLSEKNQINESNIETSKSLPSIRPATSKSSLINRFLKNVTLKKLLDAKIQHKIKNSRRYLDLYVKNIKIKPDNTEIDDELEREIVLGKERQKNDNSFDQKTLIQLKKDIFRNKLEKLIKLFPVRSVYTTNGDSKPLLVVLTSTTLYIASSKPNQYTNHFVLPYTDLNTILIGPNGQIVHISNHDNDMQCMVSTGCANITLDLISQIEFAMRRDVNKPRLPAINQLGMRDMVNLRKVICKQTAVDRDEEYFYYSIVNIQDFIPETPAMTPMGPNKEGPLMFKTSETDSSRWETAYFILKAGVLYMLSSASQRVPMRVFPLLNGSCQGARRVFNALRPHTFQLIIDGKSLLLAAPDEYVASEWLQELVHAASRTYNQREKNPVQSCSLLMTSEHILTVREAFPFTVNSLLPERTTHEPIKGAQVLSCAAISDLISFRLPSAEQSWCVLEFACREVHECSGDWILYFSSNAELENFISTLEMLWQYNSENEESFPLSTIPETDPLSKKCVDVYTSLLGTWPSNTVLLQFL